MFRILTFLAWMCFAGGADHLIAAVQSGKKDVGVDAEPGISRELAQGRAARYEDVRYELQLELVAGAPMMTGVEVLRFRDNDARRDVVLDWRMAGATQARAWDFEVNESRAGDVRQVNDHLVIPAKYLRRGENVVRLKFESPVSASGSAATRYLDREDNAEYVYTLFVPSDASTVFPCFDQPDLKARFSLTMIAPAAWSVVTNAIAANSPQQIAGDRQQWRFSETEKISTYQFAFAAGPFVEFSDQDSAHKTRMFVRRSKAARAREELAEVFRLNREALKFFANYFDYQYPFSKYDLVIVPEFAYGGMEHAGATFLREEAILFPVTPTANDFLARAELIFHEAAHQWFGDLVTMRWFDDLWLKEGFATFMAYQAISEVMPQFNPWQAFYQRTKTLAYLTDVTKGTTPIWQEIGNLSAAKSAYGNIVYRKAPSMLKQAEFFVGPEPFRQAVRAFLKAHAFGNAEWADLVKALEVSSKLPLDAWAEAWVKRRGMADVRVQWSANARGKINKFALRQKDVLGERGLWPMRIKVLLYYENAPPEIITVVLPGKIGAVSVKEAIGRPQPRFVFANYEDYGYGRFLLDAESQKAVLRDLGSINDEFLRAMLWGALWESVREAELSPERYIELALNLLARERDEVIVGTILGRVQTAFNRYLTSARRASIAPRLEKFVFERATDSPTLGLRITYFRALQSVAVTATARQQLKQLYRGSSTVPGLTLRARDRFDIVGSLLARNDEEAPALLAELERKETGADARRYAFAAGAARPSAQTKEKYFNAFLRDRQLAESWIEASLLPFNQTSHARMTLAYLNPALRALPELKRTRKIFFVNNWLAAFIGGQCSAAAHQKVQDFLQNERLDRDLRLKVLEAADGLERCIRIRTLITSDK